jgi:hypothetical protein
LVQTNHIGVRNCTKSDLEDVQNRVKVDQFMRENTPVCPELRGLDILQLKINDDGNQEMYFEL